MTRAILIILLLISTYCSAGEYDIISGDSIFPAYQTQYKSGCSLCGEVKSNRPIKMLIVEDSNRNRVFLCPDCQYKITKKLIRDMRFNKETNEDKHR